MSERHDLTVALARCKNDTVREEALKDLNEGRNYRLRLGINDPYEAQEKRRTRYQTQQEELKEYASELLDEIELRKQLKSLQEVEPNKRYSLDKNIDNEAQYNKLCGEYLREDFWEQKKNEIDKNEFVGARDLIMADNIINSGVQGEPLLGIFGAAHIEGIKNKLEQDEK